MLLNIYSTGLKTYAYTEVCIEMFTEILLIIIKNWKKLKHSLISLTSSNQTPLPKSAFGYESTDEYDPRIESPSPPYEHMRLLETLWS